MPNVRTIRQKGFEYERELASYLTEATGISISRMPMSGCGVHMGNRGLADLVGTPGLHVEAKRTERFDIHACYRQAKESVTNRRSPDAPVVITRRNRQTTGDSYVVLTLDDFMRFYNAWLAQQGYVIDTPTNSSGHLASATAAPK